MDNLCALIYKYTHTRIFDMYILTSMHQATQSLPRQQRACRWYGEARSAALSVGVGMAATAAAAAALACSANALLAALLPLPLPPFVGVMPHSSCARRAASAAAWHAKTTR